MKIKHLYIRIKFFVVIACISLGVVARTTSKTEVLVVGGGASGVAAGVQASRMGAKTIIIEESTWLGGMLTSAGVSAIDGNYGLRAGFWGEFLDSLVCHYGSYDALKTGWVSNVQFEPSVGNAIFKNITGREKNLTVIHEYFPESITKNNDGTWTLHACSNDGKSMDITAKRVIDATELGDVAKMAGVKYDVGMESGIETGEAIAPDKANNIVQDLTYVAILKDYGTDVTIEKPQGYNPNDYAGCCINPLCVNPKEPNRLWPSDKMLTYGKLPNNKYMINWPIEGNDFYLNIIEADREQRAQQLAKAKNFTMGFLYFMQHELGFTNLGLADDEFPTADKLPFIPYHRESRRIHGQVRFNFNYAKAPYEQPLALYRTNIAVGDYPVDHHHARYSGYDKLPNLYFYPIPSYGLPLGALIPRDVENFIVAEKSISVSNIINGTTRLQPVVIQIGTAAGALAALSLSNDMPVNQVKVRDVQNAILAHGGYLQPYLDAKKNSYMFAPLQRIGSTGILKGVGRKEEWTNQFWLRADTVMLESELQGLAEVYPCYKAINLSADKAVTVEQAMNIIKIIAKKENVMKSSKAKKEMTSTWRKHFGPLNTKAQIKRGEFAILVDAILDPFNRKPVDIEGNYIQQTK